MQVVMTGWELLRRFGQKAGPYLLLEILLPGGTLFALLLFLYRRTPIRVPLPAPVSAGVERRARIEERHP